MGIEETDHGEGECDCLGCRIIERLNGSPHPVFAACMGMAFVAFHTGDAEDVEGDVCASLIGAASILIETADQKDQEALTDLITEVGVELFGKKRYSMQIRDFAGEVDSPTQFPRLN